MTPTESFFAHWYFHVPNMLMAAMIYTLVGRYVLAFFFPPDSDKVVWQVFRNITDPVLNAVRGLTPAVVPNGLVMVFAIAWLWAARMFWFLTCVAAGMRPTVGA
ncbi:MAG: hypothetical protein ACREC6_01450 [Hyphomicrobiaceae bacterium]